MNRRQEGGAAIQNSRAGQGVVPRPSTRDES